MAAEGNNNIRKYIYRGEEGEVIPDDGQIIVVVREDITVILANTFENHHNIIEVICHENVEKIEDCSRLQIFYSRAPHIVCVGFRIFLCYGKLRITGIVNKKSICGRRLIYMVPIKIVTVMATLMLENLQRQT